MELSWLKLISGSISIQRHTIKWFDEIVVKNNVAFKENREFVDKEMIISILKNLLYKYFTALENRPLLEPTQI